MKFYIVALCLLLTSPAFAAATLRDIGVIGLFSHDVFAWDHENEVNTENGRVDLSTIFDYDGGSRWEKGGNPKNAENAPVYTITMQLVSFYRKNFTGGMSAEESRKATVRYFQGMIRESYQRLREHPFPATALAAKANNVEQAVLRAMHDLLPGKVRLFDRPMRKTLDLAHFLTAKTILNDKELNQPIKTFDGEYDAEYRDIRIPFGPSLDLKEIDGEFIEKFSPYQQEDMLIELAQVGREEVSIGEVSFVHHLDELFQKAFCPKSNKWMPSEMPCK